LRRARIHAAQTFKARIWSEEAQLIATTEMAGNAGHL
jgi:hypothetical protein